MTPIHGPINLRALAAWNARQDRTRAEYNAVPDTSSNTVGPCVAPDCGATAYTHRGLCRTHAKGDQ